MDKTQQRALLLEAVALLKTVSEMEQVMNACRVAVFKLKPGQTIEVQGLQVSRESLQAVQGHLEAEMAPIKQRARELQDKAMGKG